MLEVLWVSNDFFCNDAYGIKKKKVDFETQALCVLCIELLKRFIP